jgi:fluoroacetyl-CoA thioesterase
VSEAGPTGQVVATVTDADTALALGSGDVPVLGTPRLLALAEAATVAALAPTMDVGQTSVGSEVHLEHLRATPVGGTVIVRADLVAVEGAQRRFDVVAEDAAGATVGRGRVTRVVVDRQRFLDRTVT